MSQLDEGAYDNTHRAFLQAFLSRSTLTIPQAKPILAAILTASQPADRPVLPGDITDSDLNSYIAAINAALSPFDIEIRTGFTQGAGARRKIWALVNTTSDAITQLATTHTPDEIAFVKRMLDQMFDTNNTRQCELMALNSIQALNLNKVPRDRSSGVNRISGDGDEILSSQVQIGGLAQNITAAQAQKMLQSMVDEGWFEKEAGYYTLTPRALMELRGWLLETYNEPEDEDGEGGIERIKTCRACKEIVTNGQRCPDKACKARLHDQCAEGVWRMQRTKNCPICKTKQWSGNDFVGVRAGKDSGRHRTSANHVAGRRSAANNRNDDLDDDHDDGD